LNENGWEVYHRSLIEIEFIPFEIKDNFDWIFVSSSNGARLLFANFEPPENTKIGVVGEATAAVVRSFGFFPDFIGKTGNMNELGDLLARTIGKSTVLFVGAQGGSEKIRSFIPIKQWAFIPIYRTVLDSDLAIPETDVVFLTSPSNVRSYLRNTSLKGKIVLAIGHTTADFLRDNHVWNVLIPASPKESDVVKLLKRI
jgi:uroporphyrinogen-III synthase